MNDALPPLPEPDYFDTGLERRAPGYTVGRVREYVAKAVQAEREACALLVESRKTGANELMDAVLDMEAKAIRARGEKT